MNQGSKKGLIFDIKRFSVNDGPGIRTTVFFKGCSLDCLWCHNPEGRLCEIESAVRINRVGEKEFCVDEQIGMEVGVQQIMEELKKDIIVYDESGGGITLSGGEPFYQFDFLRELLIILKENYIHTAVDTSGFTSEEYIADVMKYIDLFLFDIKHLSDEEHIKFTGVSNTSILRNLDFIIKNKRRVILRMPVIPGINDSEININMIKELISGYNGYIKELHLLPFHNTAANKYIKLNINNKLINLSTLGREELKPLQAKLESTGIKVKIGG